MPQHHPVPPPPLPQSTPLLHRAHPRPQSPTQTASTMHASPLQSGCQSESPPALWSGPNPLSCCMATPSHTLYPSASLLSVCHHPPPPTFLAVFFGLFWPCTFFHLRRFASLALVKHPLYSVAGRTLPPRSVLSPSSASHPLLPAVPPSSLALPLAAQSCWYLKWKSARLRRCRCWPLFFLVCPTLIPA